MTATRERCDGRCEVTGSGWLGCGRRSCGPCRVRHHSSAPQARVPERSDRRTPPRRASRVWHQRRTVGVAFGGGSARGIAHVGVIRWLEEHRIPIDVAAGTSMGGLIGGVYATGMEAAELQTVLDTMDWDQLFGSSNFVYKNIRRKNDARDYPSRLEFGLKGGIVPPTSLNSGEYVELFLERIAAPYHDIESFDALPTPFRTVAVDLVTARQVVLRRGSLADAMRATMSLPLIFPPVVLDGHVLVDGGAMNNVPADVVKSMGADVVIAVNVGDVSNPENLSYTMLSLAGSTLDAMMRASTKKSLESADVVLNVPLHAYGSLDWRRADELADEGYRATEAMRDQLLPLAVSEAEYEAWRQERRSRRRTGIPDPTFVRLEGFGSNDAKRLESLLERHVGVPLDTAAIEEDLAELTGLDRYETITWRTARDESGRYGLRGARPPQGLCAAVHDARRQPREHHVAGLPHHGHGAVPRVRPGRVRLGTPHRRHARLRPWSGRGVVSAARAFEHVRGAVHRRADRDDQRHRGRDRDCQVRQDQLTSRHQPRRQSRRDERRALRDVYRSYERAHRGGRPQPAGDCRAGHRSQPHLARRHAGQSRGAEPGRLHAGAARARLRGARHLERRRTRCRPWRRSRS